MKDYWYQKDSYEQAIEHLSNGKRPIVCLPTGSGKTRVAQKVAADYVAQGKRVLFTAHRSELVNQSARSMPDIESCTIQSSEDLRGFDLIIIDECHHATALSYKRLIKNNPKALTLGLTATPTRLDGKSLKVQFDEIIQVAKTSELIEQGYISGIRLFAPEILIQSGAYTRDDLNLANTDRFNDLAVSEYLKIANGKKGVVFCVDRAHAHAVAASYRKSGVRAVSIDGATPTDVRAGIDRRWAAGEIDVICNCELYTEGVDLPDVDFVQILKPTESLVMYFQMIGRGMRQGGEMLLLDHTDNWQTHGLPSHDYVFTLHPEDGKTCASTSKERTQLERGEDGEVFDTGRPIVNYRLVEIERSQSKKELAREMVNEGVLNKSQIAKIVGVSRGTIRNWFQEYRLQVSSTELRQKAQILVNEGVLNKLQIAKTVGVSQSTIREWFPEYRLRFDNTGLRKKAQNLVRERVLSQGQIAKTVGVSQSTISSWFPKYRLQFANTEKKKKAQTLVNEGELSKGQIAKAVGICQSTISNWFPKYRLRVDNTELKQKAQTLVNEGVLNITQIAKTVGGSRSTIAFWFPEYRSRSTK